MELYMERISLSRIRREPIKGRTFYAERGRRLKHGINTGDVNKVLSA